MAEQLLEWDTKIAPTQFAERVLHLIQQNPWDLNTDSTIANPLEKIVDEITRNPDSINHLSSDFSNPQFNGTIALANACGSRGESKALNSLIEKWIKNGESLYFVIGFLGTRLCQTNGLEDQWRAEIDEAVEQHPAYAADITIYVDISTTGYHRLARIIDAGYEAPLKIFAQLGFGNWTRVLSNELQLDVCNRLETFFQTDPANSTRIALELLSLWIHSNNETLPSHLQDFSLKALELSRRSLVWENSYNWIQVAKQLAESCPEKIAALAIAQETDTHADRVFTSESLDEIVIKCASKDPQAVMKVLGNALMDAQGNAIYSIHRHEEVFEAIGVEIISDWVASHGEHYLKHIAGHLASPTTNLNGTIEISDVLRWVMTIHEFNDEVFNGFLSGRHRMQIWSGDAKANEVEQKMQVFLSSELRRVREWAAFESKYWKSTQALLNELDEKRERDS